MTQREWYDNNVYMNAINLTEALKPYTEGWVAIDKKNNSVVAHAKSFSLLSKKIKTTKDIFLMPVCG